MANTKVKAEQLEAAQTNITSLGTLTSLTVDNLGINGNTITANSGALNLTPASGSAIVLDGTINVDAGVVTGATSITSTAFVGGLTGNVTGNVSGTAATVTGAAQTNITSVGTLTALTVDDITIDGSTISDGGDFTLDVGGNISLDAADGGHVRFKEGGTQYASIYESGSDAILDSTGDITLDATNRIVLSADDNGEIRLQDGASLYGQFKDDSDRLRIESLISGADIMFVGHSSGGSEVTAAYFDMSDAGKFFVNAPIRATGLANYNTLEAFANGTTGQSFGLLVDAGTNTADYAAEFRKYDNTTIMRLRGDGNVGIGTSSPNSPLHVHADTGSENSITRFRNTNTTARNTRIQLEDYSGALADGILSFVFPTSGSKTGSYLGLTYNSNGLFIADGGNVGIGDNTPDYKLDVEGTGNFNDTLNFGNAGKGLISWGSMAGGTGFGMQAASGVGLSLGAGGSWDKIVIAANGKVGIGETSPSGDLHIKHGSTNAFTASNDSWHTLVIQNDGDAATNTTGIAFEVSEGAYHENAGTGIAAVKNGTASDYGADLAFITRPQSAAAMERYRIKSTGRHMFRGMDTNSTYSSLALGHTSEGSSGGYMSSWTGAFSHRLHIRMNGNASPSQHGTTTLSGSGKHNFRIMNNIGYNGVYWNSSTETGVGTKYEMDAGSFYWANTNSVGTGAQYAITYRMQLNTSGNLYITGTLAENQTISDARLKQDVEDFPSALEKMKALRTVKFNWIDEERREAHKEIGLIAQEVKEIYPELIGTTDAIGATEDPETLEKVPGEERYMMHYQKLTVVLLKAMQEQQELIESLQTKVAALESK